MPYYNRTHLALQNVNNIYLSKILNSWDYLGEEIK